LDAYNRGQGSRPRSATLASATARKQDDQRAEQTIAAENRRLTRSTEPPHNPARAVEIPIGHASRRARSNAWVGTPDRQAIIADRLNRRRCVAQSLA